MKKIVKILFLFALLFTACNKDDSPKPLTQLLPSTVYDLSNPVLRAGADSVQLNFSGGRVGSSLTYFDDRTSISQDIGSFQGGKLWVNYISFNSISNPSVISQVIYDYEIKNGKITFSLFIDGETRKETFERVYSFSNSNRDHINATLNYTWDIEFNRTF